MPVNADIQCLADGDVAGDIISDNLSIFRCFRDDGKINGEAIDGRFCEYCHMIHFSLGGLCIYIDQVKLSRFGGSKSSILIDFQNGNFLKRRFFAIVIFIWSKDKLLILFEIKYLPGAGADWFITVGIRIRMGRDDTDFSEAVRESGPGLFQMEYNSIVIFCFYGIKHAEVSSGSSFFCFIESEYDIFCCECFTIGKFSVFPDFVSVSQPVGTDGFFCCQIIDQLIIFAYCKNMAVENIRMPYTVTYGGIKFPCNHISSYRNGQFIFLCGF